MNGIKDFIEVPIALIVAICGIAYPIILQTIGQIDTKYGSTRLVDRIKRSWQYNLFTKSLWVAVVAILYYPFAPIRTCNWGIFNTFLDEYSLKIAVYLPAIVLLFSLVKFSKLTLKFYNPRKLMNSIVNDISKKKDNKKESENDLIRDYNRKETPAEAAFKDWTDLAVHGLQSSNNDTISDIYSSIYGYAIRYNKSYAKKIVEYPHYFYKGLYVINKVVCKLESELSSRHNSNIMATVLIDSYQKTRISQRSFSALWHILSTQLYVNRLDLVFSYWTSAYQHFSFNLSRYYKGQTEGVAPDVFTITEQDVANRDEDIDNFLLFHNALGALLLYREEYQFISRIFKYSNSTFPDGFTKLLITSQLHIIEMFEKVSYYESGMYIESIYPFKSIEGVTSSSQIISAIQRYLTLLLIRSENVNSSIDKRLSYIPVTLGEIKGRKEAVEKIKAIATQLFEGSIIEKIDAEYAHKEEIESKLTDYASLLDDGYNQRRIEQTFDEVKVEEYYFYFKTQFDKFIDEMSKVFHCRTNISEHLESAEDVHFYLNQRADKRQFCAGSDIGFVNFKESLFSVIKQELLYRIVYTLNKGATKTINCSQRLW